MNRIKLFLLVLIAIISPNVFCQEDSVVVTKFSDNYIEIKSLRFVLDSLGRCPDNDGHRNDGCCVVYHYRPKEIIIKDGIVLIKDRNDRPLNLMFYCDSALVQDNYFKASGFLDYQVFGLDKRGGDNKTDCYVVLFWNNEGSFNGIHYFFKKKKMNVQYEKGKAPEIIIEPITE